MTNRDSYSIIRSILDYLSLKEGSSTKIMYSCFLSNAQRTKYLNMLESKGLVTSSYGNGKKYNITHNGISLLQTLDGIRELCPFDDIT